MTESMLDRAYDASTWVFDVDATLLDGMSATSLRPGAQELLTLLSSSGRRIVVWSAGGEDYARRRLLAMGIIGFFEAVHHKGDRGDDRCYDTLRVVPAHELSAAIFVDDQPRDLPPRATVLAVRPYLAANAHDRELHRLHDAMRVRLDAATAAASAPTAAGPIDSRPCERRSATRHGGPQVAASDRPEVGLYCCAEAPTPEALT